MLIDYYRYTIVPDYGMSPYAWLVEAGVESHGIGYCAADRYGWNGHKEISDELQTDFAIWATRFEREVDAIDGPDHSFDWKIFHERGIFLTIRLKQELGADSRVYYAKPSEDPNHNIEGRMIIMEDGTVKDLPYINEYIPDAMAKIERDHNVCVLYTVESGSRAWGFASRNSDFDVRFIYIHKTDWYLSIREKRDVIEIPINDDLDISGWDLRKALGLLRKTNPPLLEWLGSPIVYQDRFGLAEKMRQFVAGNFSPRRCMLHYLHMAKSNFREYLKSDTVRVKKYFYVLRPVLACLWIEYYNTMPPTEFDRLYQDADLSPSLKHEIDNLLQRKIAGGELDMEPRIEVINIFLEEQIKHFASMANELESPDSDVDALDELFREMLQTVWKTE